MKNPHSHGIDIAQIRQERSARAMVQEMESMGRQQDRLLLPETGGYYVPLQGYQAPSLQALPVLATGLAIFPMFRPMTLRSFRVVFFAYTVNQSAVNYWAFTIQTGLGALGTINSQTATTLGVWTHLPELTTFTGGGIIGYNDAYLYIDAVPFGAPGSISLALSVYAL